MNTLKAVLHTCAAAAIWLLPASCCRHDSTSSTVTDTDDRIPILINVSQAGTKAIVNNVDDLGTQSYNGGTDSKGFAVYGYKKNVNDSYTLLFDNIEVKASENSSYNSENDDISLKWNWGYNLTRYWDSNPLVSYQFIAYWPKKPKFADLTETDIANQITHVKVSEDGDNHFLTIHNIPNWQRANTNDNPDDYLTATSSGSYQADYASKNGVVHLTFGHLLSQLVLKGYYVGIEDNKVTIKNIILNGVHIPVSNGKSSYTEPFDEFDEQDAPWYDISKADNVQHTLYTPESPSTGMELSVNTYYNTITGKNKENGDNPITQPISRWLVVPSTGWGNISLDITYSVQGASTFRSIVSGIALDSNDGTNERPGEMLPGKTYILTLVFDSSGGGINVKTVWVNGWQPAPIGINHTVYNW